MSSDTVIHSSGASSRLGSDFRRFERNLLDRSNFSSPTLLSHPQLQVDGLVGGFVEGVTDWRSLAAMTAGGMAYRIGRVGVMGLGSEIGIRAASLGLGLTAEVSAFELAHRSLQSVGAAPRGRPQLDSIWRWSGPGGMKQGFLQSIITFGTLKGAGRIARGENLVIQHLLQDSAMVLGHNVSGALDPSLKPTGTLAEQFLHAEATNLQIGAGMALASRFSPAMQALERGLDLSVRLPDRSILRSFPDGNPRTQERMNPRSNTFLEPAFAVAAPIQAQMVSEEGPARPLLSIGGKIPIVLGGREEVSRLLAEIVEKDLGKPIPKGTFLPDLWTEAIQESKIVLKESKAAPLEAMRRDFESVASASTESDFGTYREAMARLIFTARHWALYQKYGRERLFIASVLGSYNPIFQPRLSKGTQYWYPSPSEPNPPPPTDYTPGAEAWMSRLGPQLTRASQEMSRLRTREEFLSLRADENLVNRIWTYQLLHFIESVGGRVEVKDAASLAESFNPNAPSLDPATLSTAVEMLRNEGLNPEAEQVIEWEIPYYEIMFGQEHSPALKAPLSSLLRDIQYHLKGTVRLAEVGDSYLKLRIITPSLMQRLLQAVHGEQAPLLYYVDGEISRDEMMRLRELGVAAVGIAKNPLILNDVKAWVPPWAFFFHDLFHAHSMAPYSPAFRHFAASLYRHLTAAGGLPYSELREEHLRRVVDLEARPESYLRFILEHLHDIKWLTDLNWRRKFQGLEERIRFVKDYETCIDCFLPSDPEQAFLKAEVQKELIRVERKLERTRKLDKLIGLLGGRTRKHSR